MTKTPEIRVIRRPETVSTEHLAKLNHRFQDLIEDERHQIPKPVWEKLVSLLCDYITEVDRPERGMGGAKARAKEPNHE